MRKISKRTIISFDLDGVLAQYEEGWQGAKKIGEPVEGALEAITKLSAMGFHLVVNTVRGNIEIIKEWLGKNFPNIKFTINEPIWSPPNSSNKIFAHVYIDDRNIENLDEHGEPRNYTKESWGWVVEKLSVLAK